MQSGRQKIGIAGIVILLLVALFWAFWPEGQAELPVLTDSVGVGSEPVWQPEKVDRHSIRRVAEVDTPGDATAGGVLTRGATPGGVLTRGATPGEAPVSSDAQQARRREVETWVASGAEGSVEEAIAAAKAEPTLRETVVQAFGQQSSERAAQYVADALRDEDLAVRCAAIGAWEAMKGEAAIPEIAKLLEENRERPDGYSVEVAEACVKALGATRASEALPALEKELQWVAMQEAAPLLIGYGSAVIEAVADIGDSRSATMLENFAEALQGKLSGMPTIRHDQMLQMAEAYVRADELR